MSDLFISREQAEGDLLAAAAFLAERIKSADGRAEAMKAVVPLYLSRGEVDLAAELANAVDDPFARDKLLTIVAEKCAEMGDDDYALQLAEAVDEHALRAEAYERVALIIAAKGGTARAGEIAAGLPHPDYVFGGIAVTEAAKGNSESSDEALDRIEFAAARVSALQRIAAALIEKGKTDAAVGTLGRAVVAADDIEHDEEHIRALCDIAGLFLDAGRHDKSIETYASAREQAELLDNIHRDPFLVSCALGFMFAGSDELAERTLDLVTDKTQMASALLGMAREYWKREQKDDAMDALDEAYQILRSQRDIETRDSRSRNSLMASIGAQFAGFGRAERAIEIAQENQDPAEETNALTQIAQILAVQNEDDLARQTVNSIAEDADRVTALIGVSDAKWQLNEKEKAVDLLAEADSMVGAVPQFGSRSQILTVLASRFAAHSERDRSRAALSENLNVIAQIRDESSQAAALAGLADMFRDLGFEPSQEELTTVVTLLNRAEFD
jgi:tetratricopeptide (TPR) repeat protein